MGKLGEWFPHLFGKKEDAKPEAISQSRDYHEEERIREIKLWNLRNIFFAFWISIFFIATSIVVVGFFVDTLEGRIVLWTVLSITYAIILFFLLEPRRLKEILRKEIRIVEKEVPVIREITKIVDRPVEVEKPVYRDVIKIVEKPVYRDVEKPVYYPMKKPKLDIPKYDYVASNSTGTYHKSNCRLGKSIKQKYKERTNNVNDFKRKKYHPCKFCITKQVKV